MSGPENTRLLGSWEGYRVGTVQRFEADLGGYLFKKRIAKEGKGKSTSYRVIVALKKFNSDKLFFLFGFDKNDLSKITEKDKKAHGISADVLLHLTDTQIARLLSDGILCEIVED